MANVITYKDLIAKCDYIEECGNGNQIKFEVVSEEDYNVLLTLNGNVFMNVHLYDTVRVVEGNLIMIGGRVCEAIKCVRVEL